MAKRLLILLAVIGFAFCGTVFAGVENIKVSGDITVHAINRSDFHLGSEMPGIKSILDGTTTVSNDDTSVLASVAKLRFDADLTEDVSAVVVLQDERVWGLQTDDIYAEEVYVSMKNVLESPLSLKIGVQPVKLGFIGMTLGDFGSVGSGLTNYYAPTNSAFQEAGIDDLSPRKSIGGITASLDLAPFVIDAGYLKYSEDADTGLTTATAADTDNDRNVYFANIAYLIEGMRAVEVYYVADDTQDTKVGGNAATGRQHNIQNTGLRLLATPISDLLVVFESCYQYQHESPFYGGREDGDAQTAWAAVLGAKYTFRDMEWMPHVVLSYTYLSPKWDGMYEDASAGRIINALTPGANSGTIALTVGARPMDDLAVSVKYINCRLVDPIGTGSMAYVIPGLGLGSVVGNATSQRYLTLYHATYQMTDDKPLFNEVDVTWTYDYSEDVQMTLCTDWFMPDDAFASVNDETAFQALGTLKVSF